MHHGGNIHEFGVILSYSPGSLSINDLVEAYFTNTKNKSILDDRSVLIKIVQLYQRYLNLFLTFQKVWLREAANKAFFGRSALKYHKPLRYSEENAKMGNLEFVEFFIDEYFTSTEDYTKTKVYNVAFSFNNIFVNAAKMNHLHYTY